MPAYESEITPSRARYALTIMEKDGQRQLSPFFGYCDGILLISQDDGSQSYHRNKTRTAKFVCQRILSLQPDAVICGHIPQEETAKLRAQGIEVRLGSCAMAIPELINCFNQLPVA